MTNRPRRSAKRKRSDIAALTDNAHRLPDTPQSDSETGDVWQTLQRSIGNAAVGRLHSVQKQADIEPPTPIDESTQAGIEASRGQGEALDGRVQQQLEQYFGADATDVSVHTGEDARRMTESLDARAFTQGRDVFFAPGQYEPGSTEGRAVIAHEVAHVARGTERVGVVHCAPAAIPMPFAPGERYADGGPQMSLADPGGEVSTAPEYGASEGGKTREMVGGVEYVADTALEWELGGNELIVTVPINFVGEAPDSAWFPQIRSVWNHFDLVNTATGERVVLAFVPKADSAGYTVKVTAGKGRANESNWFLGDTRPTTAPHEFGHMLGLQDEYQVTKEHYEGVTGQEAPQGDDIGGGGTIDSVTEQLHTEITTPGADQPDRIYGVVYWNAIQQGEYAQAILKAYKDQYGDLIPALVAIQKSVKDDQLYLYKTIEAFSYTSGSIMGGSGAIDHDHGAQPRHVRRFAQIVQQQYGGSWRPEYAY